MTIEIPDWVKRADIWFISGARVKHIKIDLEHHVGAVDAEKRLSTLSAEIYRASTDDK